MANELASPLLADALVILGAAGVVIPLFARFRITPVIGFLLVGLLVGPHALGALSAAHPWLAHVTIADTSHRDSLARFGLILLLFSGGLELSFDRLREFRREVLGRGSLELLVTAALLCGALLGFGYRFGAALTVGLALAMSSTALVLRVIATRTPAARAATAMLLFEDIALVPIVLLLDVYAPFGRSGDPLQLAREIPLGTLAVAGLLLAGRVLLPRLFAQAARTKSPELFLASSLLVVVAASLVTTAAGLSPLAGAMIAGLLIAETDYHNEIEALSAPFKGLALGVFLIAVGMAINLQQVWANLWPVLGATLAVLVLKALVTGALLRAMGAERGVSAEVGILLASPSETTLIVLAAGVHARLISADTAQFWQIVTAIGLIVTPLLAALGRKVGQRVGAVPLADPAANGATARAIIVGGGRVGRMVAEMLAEHDRPCVVIDADADLVAEAQAAGIAAVYGDAARGNALERLGLDTAPAVILTMDEPVLAARLVRRLRAHHPGLTIIARARDAAHAAQLYRAGASHAVPETLESSLQLSEAVLVDLGVPMGFVIASVHEKRDALRTRIMEEGGLSEKPRLKSAGLRSHGA